MDGLENISENFISSSFPLMILKRSQVDLAQKKTACVDYIQLVK